LRIKLKEEDFKLLKYNSEFKKNPIEFLNKNVLLESYFFHSGIFGEIISRFDKDKISVFNITESNRFLLPHNINNKNLNTNIKINTNEFLYISPLNITSNDSSNKKLNPIYAYWCSFNKNIPLFVDIPKNIINVNNEITLLFTVTLTGCQLITKTLENNYLRIYHNPHPDKLNKNYLKMYEIINKDRGHVLSDVNFRIDYNSTAFVFMHYFKNEWHYIIQEFNDISKNSKIRKLKRVAPLKIKNAMTNKYIDIPYSE
jgi:hypothetical protein